MRVLFLNYTFPGPFQHLAAAFGTMPETTTLFASEYGRRDFALEGVQRVLLSRPKDKKSKPDLSDLEKLEWDMNMAFQRGRMTASSFLKLRSAGFIPDILISSATMGNSLFVRTVFPEAFMVAYGDWYFKKETATPAAKNSSSQRNSSARLRNSLQLLTLSDSNWTFTSTEWQKKQYPAMISEEMQTIPLSVDTDFFSPLPEARFQFAGCDLSDVQELVTISASGMEYSEHLFLFIKSLPALLARRKKCHVAILTGGEPHALSSLLGEMSWSDAEAVQRVHILSSLPQDAYRTLLRASSLYVYPFGSMMLSSGLIEAMSCGCPLLAGDSEVVREVISGGKNGFLYATEDSISLANSMAELLECSPYMANIRDAARHSAQEKYSVNKALKKNVALLLERFAQWRAYRPLKKSF